MSAGFPGDFSRVNPVFTIPRYRPRMDAVALLRSIEKWIALAVYLLIGALCLAFATPVLAQSTTTVSNTSTGNINNARTCTNPLVRNINVSDSFTIADVNIGILVTHSWRGDLQFTLQSPGGTRVQLTNGDTNSVSGDNFNVLLDDSAAQLVNTDSATGNHSTTAPPYQNTFRPRNPLSAFNGENSAGTWRLETCDLFPSADDGSFRRADLTLTSVPTNFADLSLRKVLVGSPPVQGGTATWRLTVTNASNSPLSADNIVVRDTFPSGFSFISASGDGSFNSATGDWSVGSLAPGQSKILTIAGTVSAATGSTVTNVAQITASSAPDTDSTVNNGVTSEDDYASASFVVQTGRAPGIPPILSCPAGTSLFDWDSVSGWAAGSTSNSFAFAGYGNIGFSLTNDGTYINNAALGGQSPSVIDLFGGGLTPSERTLSVIADQPNRSGDVEITITLPRAFTGLQFSIFDVDFGANQFADRLEVVGFNGGASVNPVLTNGNANFVSPAEPNVLIGNAASDTDAALGNAVVTFTQAVDTIVIRYGNHSTAPANPGQQGIGIHDIVVCDPFATLTVSKVSSIISDPVNGTSSPKAIPGATVEYLITVTNTGTSATQADTVTVWDDGPADAKLCLIGRAGGPIIFNDPGGNSNLAYSFSSLSSASDNLEFSNNDGSSFAYTPVADGDGCDTAVTDFRVRPSGAFAGGATFTITVRFRVE